MKRLTVREFHSVTHINKCLWLLKNRRNLQQAFFSHLKTRQQLFHLSQCWDSSKLTSSRTVNRWSPHRKSRQWKTTNKFHLSTSRSRRWWPWSTQIQNTTMEAMIKLQLRWRNNSKLKVRSMLCSWRTSRSDRPRKKQKSSGAPKKSSTSRLAGKTSSSSARFAKASSIRCQMWWTTCASTQVTNLLSASSVEWLSFTQLGAFH